MMDAASVSGGGPLDRNAIAGLSARDKQALVDKLTVMVNRLVGRVAARVPRTIDVDDLLGAGMIALFEALARFPQANANDFHKYAAVRVKGAILDALRAQDPMSRAMRQKSKRVHRTMNALAQALGRPPTDAETAERLHLDPEAFRALQEQIQPVVFASVEGLAEAGTDVSSLVPEAFGTDPEDAFAQRDLSALLHRELEKLASPAHQLVIKFCFFDGMTNREIARVLDLSESRVSQLLSEAIAQYGRRVRAVLGGDMPPPAHAETARHGVHWHRAHDAKPEPEPSR